MSPWAIAPYSPSKYVSGCDYSILRPIRLKIISNSSETPKSVIITLRWIRYRQQTNYYYVYANINNTVGVLSLCMYTEIYNYDTYFDYSIIFFFFFII